MTQEQAITTATALTRTHGGTLYVVEARLGEYGILSDFQYDGIVRNSSLTEYGVGAKVATVRDGAVSQQQPQ